MTITPEQRTAAKVAGWIYLIAMATSMFAELYLRGPLIVSRDAVQTALNIAASERAFRISSVIHLLTFASDAMLAVALYTILKPVNRSVALLAAFWRLADCGILTAAVLNDFAALRFLASTDYLRAFDTQQLQVLARVFISIGAAGYQLGFVFLGLGSTAFSYLWLRSGYIPRPIAVWGIFASLVLTLGTLAIVIFPTLGVIGLSYMAPMFFYEVGLGLWLLVKGLREHGAPGPTTAV
ncbi:MAG TPA: DUF4386 domain-containing protein [Thermoanaerobaculia bacterium]|nr:DUF4386 domain-containing protein [Thermoanaerobaculia bacterium]